MTEAAPVALTPLAVEQAPLLRRLAEIAASVAAPPAKAALAAEFGKDPSNLNKILARLAGEGLIASDSRPATLPTLTDQGRAALDALARAEGRAAEGGDKVLPTGLAHERLVPDPDNRKDDDPEAAEFLRESIARDGLIHPLLVRADADPDTGAHMLIAGERRWRAIGALIQDGRWPAARPIPVTFYLGAPADHARLQLIENLQRKNLHPLDEAEAFQRLVSDHGVRTADIASEIGCTQRMVQQRLQLLELSDNDQARLREGKINLEQARVIIANRPKPLNLAPAVWLAVLEVFDKLQRAPKDQNGERPGYVLCLPLSEEEAATLKPTQGWPTYLLEGPRAETRYGVVTGAWSVSDGYQLETNLQLRFGDDYDNPEARQAMLESLRREVVSDCPALEPGQYLTRWLAGEQDADPALLAKAAEALAAQEAAREEQASIWRKRREQQEAREATLKAMGPRAEQLAMGFRDGSAGKQDVADLAAAIGMRLPWRWVRGSQYETGHLADADGEEIELDYDVIEAIGPLIMASMNAHMDADPVIQDPAADDGADEEDDEDASDDEAETEPFEPIAESAGAALHALYQDDFAAQVRAAAGDDA